MHMHMYKYMQHKPKHTHICTHKHHPCPLQNCYAGSAVLLVMMNPSGPNKEGKGHLMHFSWRICHLLWQDERRPATGRKGHGAGALWWTVTSQAAPAGEQSCRAHIAVPLRSLEGTKMGEMLPLPSRHSRCLRSLSLLAGAALLPGAQYNSVRNQKRPTLIP